MTNPGRFSGHVRSRRFFRWLGDGGKLKSSTYAQGPRKGPLFCPGQALLLFGARVPIAEGGRSRIATHTLTRRRDPVAQKKTPMLGRPTPSRLLARTMGDKPISCVERCTPRSTARYGRLSARIAVSRRKRACCI